MSEDALIHRLGAGDGVLLRALMACFVDAFEDPQHYVEALPSDAYLADLLANDGFVALVALAAEQVVGGLTAYDLPKPERAHSELYLYDLAVAESHRRRGIATALIAALHRIASARQAAIVYVQADPEDEAAVALYTKLGTGRDVLHFDLMPTGDPLASGDGAR